MGIDQHFVEQGSYEGFGDENLTVLKDGDLVYHHGLKAHVEFIAWTGEIAQPRRRGAVLRFAFLGEGFIGGCTDTAVAGEISIGGNPVVRYAVAPNDYIAREYADGHWDAVKGDAVTIGCDSYEAVLAEVKRSEPQTVESKLPEQQYTVLVDAGTDWPDVVFVGSWDEAVEFDRKISNEFSTSIQAVVTLDDVRELQEEI